MSGASFQALLMAGTVPKVLTFQGSAQDGTSQTTYTFNTQPFGTAAADRRIIVGFAWANNNVTVSSVTIGGVAATAVASGITSQGGAALYIAAVPTGTTGSVVVTLSGASGIGMGLAVWSATGLTSNTPASSGNATANGTSQTVNLGTTTQGGFVVAISGGNITSGNYTACYAPGGTLDVAVAFSGIRVYGGGHNSNTSTGGVTVTSTQPDGGNAHGTAAAAW